MSQSAQGKTTAQARKQPLKNAKAKTKKKKLIEKKQHLEFIASLLTIPFLISVLILNYNSIKNLNKANVTPTPAPYGATGRHAGFFSAPIGTSSLKATQDPAATSAPCVKGLGSVSITSPSEGDAVNSNPVEVDISYDDSTHCGAAWSYRINGGDWSGYDDRSVALYNLPQGNIKFELRVKSIAGSDTTSLTRNFVYNGSSSSIIPTTASGSAH